MLVPLVRVQLAQLRVGWMEVLALALVEPLAPLPWAEETVVFPAVGVQEVVA